MGTATAGSSYVNFGVEVIKAEGETVGSNSLKPYLPSRDPSEPNEPSLKR